jgi:hypothetical protein
MVFKEIQKSLRRIGSLMGFQIKHEDCTRGYHGHISMKVFNNDGALIHSYESPNVIVNSASVLMARLLKDPSEPSTGGITHLAVGVGGSEWDTQNPPVPTTSQTSLVNELFRKPVSRSVFINPEDGSEAGEGVYTNVVDYTFHFKESEAAGALVEMGLFGGDASLARGTGTMVNYRTFPVLNKSTSMAFVIIVRITT